MVVAPGIEGPNIAPITSTVEAGRFTALKHVVMSGVVCLANIRVSFSGPDSQGRPNEPTSSAVNLQGSSAPQ